MANRNLYKVGDVVKLKSGGPDMTVLHEPVDRDSMYTCQWFAGKQLSNGRFREESLISVESGAQ